MAKTHAGERLRLWRVSQDLNQIELARLLNTTQAQVSLYETGRRTPDGKMMVKVQLLTGIEPAAWHPDLVEQAIARAAS
jgi:transcriptional regulator with XRE-family HTH domain